MAISILLAQTNYLVKEGLKALVYNDERFILSGEALSEAELLRIAEKRHPNLVIMDHMDPAFGISAIRKMRAALPQTFILTISDKPSRWMLSDAMAGGITSYLLRDCEREEILEAILATANGEQFFCGKIISDVLKSPDEMVLPEAEAGGPCEGLKISSREAEIIRYVAEGLTNKEIADKLYLSAHTVTTHRKNIMSKLGVNNTAGLVLFAIRNNIVTPNHFLFNTN
jgi:DNA-binding NarL/FixJ family response regulator